MNKEQSFTHDFAKRSIHELIILPKSVYILIFFFFNMYVFLTPPPLPGVIIGLVKCPGTVCARLHFKFPRVEGGDPQNGL